MIELRENIIFAGRYKLVKQIGRGGFSEVWLAKDQMAKNTEIALKVFVPEKGLDDIGIKQFSEEYALTQPLNHPNLLKPSYFDIIKGSPYLIMPFMKRGSLTKMLYEQGTLKEKDIAKIIKDIASALSYLHKHKIVHQDIKPDNILIDEENNYLLTDFGISSRMRSTLRKHSTNKSAMTVAYAPPERFGKRPQTLPAGDVFSLAVMVYELTTGEVPWMGAGGVVLTNEDQIPLIPESYSQELCDIIEKCMSINPYERPSTDDLLNSANSYLQTGKWSKIKASENAGFSQHNFQQKEYETEKKIFEAEKQPKGRATVIKPQSNQNNFEQNNSFRNNYQSDNLDNRDSQRLKEKLKKKIINSHKTFLRLYISSFIIGIIGIFLMAYGDHIMYFTDEFNYYYYRSIFNFGALLVLYAVVSFIIGIIFSLVVLHTAWKSIQDGNAFTTPGKAVGYLFIPFFNYYWIFIAYRRLFIDMNTYTKTKRADVGFATFVCVITLIPYVNMLTLIFMPILFTKIKNNTLFVLEQNK